MWKEMSMPGRCLTRVASILGGISLLFPAGGGWTAGAAETKPAAQEAETAESLALKIGFYQSMERYYELVKPPMEQIRAEADKGYKKWLLRLEGDYAEQLDLLCDRVSGRLGIKAQLPFLYDKRRFAREAAHLKSVRGQWVRKILGYKQDWLKACEAKHKDQTEMAKIAEKQLVEVRKKLAELKARQVAPPPRAEPKGVQTRETFYPGTKQPQRRYSYYVKDGRHVMHGKDENWFSDGSRQAIQHYKHGKVHEMTTLWRSPGKLVCQTEYFESKKHGVDRRFRKDGTLRAEYQYVVGQRQGMARFYDQNSCLTYEQMFRENKQSLPLIFYWPSGRRRKQIVVTKDEKVGDCTHYDKGGVKLLEGPKVRRTLRELRPGAEDAYLRDGVWKRYKEGKYLGWTVYKRDALVEKRTFKTYWPSGREKVVRTETSGPGKEEDVWEHDKKGDSVHFGKTDKKGKKHGLWRTERDHKLRSTTTYVHGEKHGPQTLYENGVAVKEITYKHNFRGRERDLKK